MIFRYVAHHRVTDYERLGWMVEACLGAVHGEWSVLMGWRCGCRVVEPRA